MTLNATLFVQMINFIIAYIIIDRLLLRKSVKIIQHERSEQDDLMKDIQLQRDRVSGKQEDKQAKCEGFCVQFEAQSPHILIPPSFKDFEKDVEVPKKPSMQDIKYYADDLEALLVKKVMHANK